jgi:hypothetical protein
MPNTPGSTLVGSPIEISNQTDTPIARANQITVDTTSFTGNLSGADDLVQLALETIDQLSLGGLVDGDYGDITVGGTGTTMTIDNGVVTLDKAADDLKNYIVAMSVAL